MQRLEEEKLELQSKLDVKVKTMRKDHNEAAQVSAFVSTAIESLTALRSAS